MQRYNLISAHGSYKKPTYETLEKWLDVLEWTYTDFFKKGCCIDIGWGDYRLEAICNYLDSANSASAMKLYGLAVELLPNTIRAQFDISDDYTNYGRRITDMIMVKANEDNNALKTFQELGIGRRWEEKKHAVASYKAVPIEYYPAVAQRFGMSLHWMLNLDESTTILARKGSTEKLMDVITMLPDHTISALYRAILIQTR